MGRGKGWLWCFFVLWVGCVANDRSTRPPNVAPAPPQDLITVGGFDDAMHIASDYIYASQLPDRVFLGSQELPGNLWLLRFGPGPTGGAPIDLVVDLSSGSVKEAPAGAYGTLKPLPSGQPASDAPSVPQK